MSKRMTVADLAAIVAAQNEQIASLVAALAPAPAPVKAAPAQAKAHAAFGNRTFEAYVAERVASRIACEIHAAEECNREFSPKSSGRENHVARIVA